MTSLALVAAAAGIAGCGAVEATRREIPIPIPESQEPSAIYAADGTLLTNFVGEQYRVNVPIDQIPQVIQDAVVAIEDQRFYEHDGVDYRAVLRAAKENQAAQQVSQGGSTITQQYVKNALLSNARTLARKLEEAALARRMESTYSKDTILELYLNTVYFGNGAYGVEAASRAYFNIPATSLNLPQATLLAGLINGPARDDPYSHPKAATDRRNEVISRMVKLGYISPADGAKALYAPLGVAATRPAPTAQPPYAAAHFVNAVKQWMLTDPRFGETSQERSQFLYGGGLRIYTTIDLDLQGKAEQAVRGVLSRPGRDPDASLVAIEPKTGYVKAMVGGYNFFGSHPYAQVNLAMGSGRSTGSSFKAIVLATALSRGVTPQDTFPSPAMARLPGWTVRGGGGLGGTGTVEDCTVFSSNTCYANMILSSRVGVQNVIDMARNLGISSRLDPVGPTALGANNTSVLEMASAYSTFANGGIHVPPVMVTKIVKLDGSVVYQSQHQQSKVLEADVNLNLVHILEGVVARGTAKDEAPLGRPAAGKTGTSQDNHDAWFVGFTPDLATAVWVGFAEPGTKGLIPMTPPRTAITVYGGTWPARIWNHFMTSALAATPPSDFRIPLPKATDTTLPPIKEYVPADAAPSRSKMPDVTGRPAGEAASALRGAGFDVRRIGVTTSDPNVGPGMVVAQSPPAGTEILAGTTVNIEATAGQPAPRGGVPDARGVQAQSAVDQLAQLGYRVTTVVVAAPPGPDGAPLPSGVVWDQTPTPGAVSPTGDITLSVSP